MNALLEKAAIDPLGLQFRWLTKIQKVLVAVDLQAGCEHLVESVARLIGTQSKASVILCHVIENSSAFESEIGVVPDPIPPVVAAAAKSRLETLTNLFLPNINVEIVLRYGHPAVELCACSEDSGVDLIVINTHGYAGLKRFWKGSTAEGVVHRARCAVLVMRMADPRKEAPWQLNRLAVAYDDSEGSRAALALALQLSHTGAGSIDLIRAVKLPTVVMEEMPELAVERELGREREHMQNVCLNIPYIRHVNALVLPGEPAQVIQSVLEEGGYDLLLIGANSRWQLSQYILGTTPERVVRHAPCPVLVLRPSERCECN